VALKISTAAQSWQNKNFPQLKGENPQTIKPTVGWWTNLLQRDQLVQVK
jgi:hypothetical protein